MHPADSSSGVPRAPHPALTAAQWTQRTVQYFDHPDAELPAVAIELDDQHLRGVGTLTIEGYGRSDQAFAFKAPERHALAALCLYGQEFGFTQADVDLLTFVARDEWNGDEMEIGRALLSIANRIAALLPPRVAPGDSP